MATYRKKAKGGIWIWIGIVACICVMLYAGFQIYSQTEEDNRGDSAYADLRQAVTRDGPDHAAAAGQDTMLPEEQPPDISALRELSGNAVGWIYSEGTPVDYPVVQGTDNSFYLTHLYDGTKNKVGAIFLDYRNAPDFSDQNSVLYGHHMKSGRMFAELEKYKKQSYYDSHPSILLYTQDGDYRIDLVAGYVVDGSVNDLKLNFEGEELAAFLKEAKGKSTFQSGTAVEKEDRIVTMVTCTYDFANARYALVGKLVRI